MTSISATGAAAIAINGDNAIKSSIVIGSLFIFHRQFSILHSLAGKEAPFSCQKMENGELTMENGADCVSPFSPF
jgi:hypothetical protein